MEDAVIAKDRRYASRKFILSCSIWATGTLVWIAFPTLGLLPLFDTAQWIHFSQWVLGLYMAGNVGDTAATKLFDIMRT